MNSPGIHIFPLEDIPEVTPGDDLAGLILEAARGALEPNDVLVVTHKVVSKAEGRLVDLREVEPSALAVRYAEQYEKDPRHVEVVLRQSQRIVRMDRGLIIAQTLHGFTCANAGVDASNVPGEEVVCLLPEDPDRSAREIREDLRSSLGFDVAVVISDSFGRPWRSGIVNIAIGAAGIEPLVDYRGKLDASGRELKATVIAVADELASAAELVTGKTDARPVVVIRGYCYEASDRGARALVMEPERDLFR